MKTKHQKRIEKFMRLAKQNLPIVPTISTPEVRYLRAKLILEEALETISALGFALFTDGRNLNMDNVDLLISERNPLFLGDIIDGCCDLSVVTIGTLSALGIPDKQVLKIVDDNNLDKFGPGHTIDKDGKLIKPPNHPKPDFSTIIFPYSTIVGVPQK